MLHGSEELRSVIGIHMFSYSGCQLAWLKVQFTLDINWQQECIGSASREALPFSR